MNKSHRVAALIALGAGAAIAVPALSQKNEPPIARYTVDAGTTSGMAAMGRNPMAMLRGGGGQAMHELILRLGSSRTATGEPKADHFMPAGAGLGESVPLVTPQRSAAGPTGLPGYPGQMPKGKLSLYWGCGEHAPQGQPVVIDFSKLAQGQIPPGLFAAATVADDWRITMENSKTYGDWPNGKDRKRLTGNSSILGAHKVTSTYAPEIDFTLADDFMPPLQPRTSDMASGATDLTWGALPKATGYYAWVIATNSQSGGDNLDMVWWTSSATQQFGGFLGDWLSPDTVRKLVDAKTVMPPGQTSCAIPAEVKQSGGPMLMTQLYAYGPQADFAYPPRPSDPKAVWKPEWIARVRFRANAMVMAGMPDMGSMMRGAASDEQDDTPSTQPQQPQGKPTCPGGLRGLGMRAAGVCQ